jgi:hypothetical protein
VYTPEGRKGRFFKEDLPPKHDWTPAIWAD